MRQMEEIKANVKDWTKSENVVRYLERIADKKAGDGTGLIYGLGHAVYTISDPRAQLLKEKAKMLAEANDRMDEFALYDAIAPRGNPACRGTFGGRRKAVRDRLALQGGTGDFP